MNSYFPCRRNETGGLNFFHKLKYAAAEKLGQGVTHSRRLYTRGRPMKFMYKYITRRRPQRHPPLPPLLLSPPLPPPPPLRLQFNRGRREFPMSRRPGRTRPHRRCNKRYRGVAMKTPTQVFEGRSRVPPCVIKPRLSRAIGTSTSREEQVAVSNRKRRTRDGEPIFCPEIFEASKRHVIPTCETWR